MTGTHPNRTVARTENGSVTVDSTYFPVLIATWAGAMSTELIDRYFELRNPLTQRADTLGAKVIVITDISRMQVPPATLRKHFGDRAAETDRNYASMLGYVVFAPSAMLRGIITAVSWLLSDATPPRLVASMDAAFALTKRLYQQAGAECPQLPVGEFGGTP